MGRRQDGTISEPKNVKNQNKGLGPQRTTTLKGRCSHCGKWGYKQAKCREWLRLTHDEQEKTDEECSEEKPKKSMEHI